MGYFRGYSDGLEESWYECAEARRQLAEAAEAVRLLLELLRKAGPPMPWSPIDSPTVIAYRALPAWMRKEIER